ncbi:MAG: type I-G CRISPR-associated protein Cas8g1/Csx17, partial [Bryobacteraceae bacterium]
MPELILAGCTTKPLLSYLKALGILRIVAEDGGRGDPAARGLWRDGVFILISRFDADALERYLHSDYQPTPIVVPWSGGDYFGVRREGNPGPHPKAPTSTRIIEALLASRSGRLAHYRATILQVLDIMQREGINAKEKIEGAKGKESKSRFLAALRSRAGDRLVAWIDAAAIIEDDRVGFNVLLGSGGGSDGNSHYSDNFMQHLWDVLPEFTEQGSKHSKLDFVRNSLFATPVKDLSDRTPSLFSSGSVGGPNSTEGFEGGSLLNSWDFILALEGAICFAGAVSRKLGATGGALAFPFSVTLSAAGYGTAVDKESGQREIWFPVWNRPLNLPELLLVFSEGRAQTGRRPSRTGSDFARAVAGFGVDSGIEAFERFAFVKGRVGGDNYTTAVPIGLFQVHERRETALLLEIDDWLDRFRRACGEDATPPRFTAALRRIENAIVEFCRHGGAIRMAAILCALGNAEKELAAGERFRSNEQRTIPPVPSLTPEWVAVCDDGSPEFRLAAAVAGIAFDFNSGVGHIRQNLEPVEFSRGRWNWASGESAVWKDGEL